MIIRKQFPKIYRFKNKTTGQTYYIVDCRSKKWGTKGKLSFQTQAAAETKALDIEDEILKFGGNAHVEKDVITESNLYRNLVDLLKPFGHSPEKAVEHYINFLGQQSILNTIPRIEILIADFEKYKLMDNTLSDKTVTEIKSYCRYILNTWGHLKPCELSRDDVEMTLRKMSVSNNTRRKYLTYIKMFMAWVYENKAFLTKNPIIGIKFKKEKFAKDFYSVDSLKTFFLSVDKEYPQLLGYYVLSTFAGLRPSESARVKWEHINFETKELHVNKGMKGKSGERHIVLTDTVISWLGYIKFQYNPIDLIPQRNLENFDKAARVFMGEWIQDGLRHTFATNYQSLHKDFYKTAGYMGNSPQMIKQHYAKTIGNKELTTFWGLTPIEVFKAS